MSKMGRNKNYPNDVQKLGVGVEATFGQCPEESHFFYVFLKSGGVVFNLFQANKAGLPFLRALKLSQDAIKFNPHFFSSSSHEVFK